MAGRGALLKEWRESIIQYDRFNARSDINELRQSGTSLNKLEDKSRYCSVLATGDRLNAFICVRELSARLSCRRNLHLDAGTNPYDKRLDELPLGVFARSVEPELPDDRRKLGVPLLE
jgi:hypothetical protein